MLSAQQLVDISVFKESADSLRLENKVLEASMKKIAATPSLIPSLPVHEAKYTWDCIKLMTDMSPFPRAGHRATSIFMPSNLNSEDSPSTASRPYCAGILLYGGERDNLWLNDVWLWVPKSYGSVQIHSIHSLPTSFLPILMSANSSKKGPESTCLLRSYLAVFCHPIFT